MRAYEGAFTLRLICRVLSVSPSGYDAWRDRMPPARALARTTLAEWEAFKAGRARAGAPRLAKHLGKGGGRLPKARAGKACGQRRRRSSR
jgi:hypothetical protein